MEVTWAFVEGVAVFVLAYFSYMLGKGDAKGDNLTLKRENERLNSELRILTERDSRGRFTGGK